MSETLLQPRDVLQGTRDKYIILNLIGRGGMGAVYRVQRVSDKTIWAIKEMRPPPNSPEDENEDNRRLFKQEYELLSQLDHPNILMVSDFFTHQGRPVMVMEYIDGKTLEDIIHESAKSLDEYEILYYGIQLCRVLHYLHTRTPPIIYRDLKPPNVMRKPDGVLKLIDFGVARTRKKDQAKDTIAMGSAGYAPPEQYGKEQTDARSDIYALGATLYHLATGSPPIPLHQVRVGDIRKHMRSMKARTEHVIIKAMWLKRDGRFASGVEMEKALMECLDQPYVDPTAQKATSGKASAAAPPTPSASAPATPSVPSSPQHADAATSTEELTCSHCGRVNKAGARFCAGCGMPLGVTPSARLVIRSPQGTWEQKLDRFPFRIGRRDPKRHHYPELDLAEHDRGVASRNHATIYLADDVYTLTDLGSTNGTMINDEKIVPNTPHRLKPGDRIRVGEVDMEFCWT